jgi:ArsR family transcriptional regulator, arsenate/arsenite/antimonite-responsive transcriptional repressor
VRKGLYERLPSQRCEGAGSAVAGDEGLATRVSATLSPIACCAPLANETISDDEAVATAEIFRALGDPHRVKIVNLLATSAEPVCVCNLIEPLGLSQPTVSHHLKKLLDAGLVDREQRGKWAYFSLNGNALRTLALVVDLRGAC